MQEIVVRDKLNRTQYDRPKTSLKTLQRARKNVPPGINS